MSPLLNWTVFRIIYHCPLKGKPKNLALLKSDNWNAPGELPLVAETEKKRSYHKGWDFVSPTSFYILKIRDYQTRTSELKAYLWRILGLATFTLNYLRLLLAVTF